MAQRKNFPGRRIRQMAAISRKETRLKTYNIFLDAEHKDIAAKKGNDELHIEARDRFTSIAKAEKDLAASKSRLIAA